MTDNSLKNLEIDLGDGMPATMNLGAGVKGLSLAVNRERFSAIGHEGIEFWNPVAPDVLNLWIDQLPLTAASEVLDVGCGRAAFLIRVVERFGCRGIGIDLAQSSISAAIALASARSIDARLELRCESFAAESLPDRHFDLAACIGSTHAIADLKTTFQVLTQLIKPGGLLLVGEGYWQREPEAGYLDFLGCTPADLRTHPGNLALAEELSFDVLATHETSAEAWSEYEDAYAGNIERFVLANPDDPETPGMAEKIRAWREAYLRWGKDTLGFGLYLLRSP